MTSRRHKGSLVGALLFAGIMITIVAVPVASAASLWGVGEWEWGFNLTSFLMGGAIVCLLGGIGLTAAFVSRIPLVGAFATAFGLFGAVTLVVVAAFVNPGGAMNGDAAASILPGSATASPPPAAASTTASAAGSSPYGSGAWTSAYVPQSDVGLSAYDAFYTGNILYPSVKVFAPGVDHTAAVTGAAQAWRQVTLSSSVSTLNDFPTQQYGCSIDILYDLANYYQELVRNVPVCKKANVNDNEGVSTPPVMLKLIGTPSLSLTTNSLTCAAAAQCTEVVRFTNSNATSWIKHPAIYFKIVTSDSAGRSTNGTLDSVDASARDCEVTTSGGNSYIKFTGAKAEIGPSGTVECIVRITHSGGGASDPWKYVGDDLFQQDNAAQFVGNSAIRNAAATADYAMTFA